MLLPMIPVYPWSICITKSTHEGMLPGPTYPYFANHQSTEVHTVQWVPGPWAKFSRSVWSDAHANALDGHDTGMLIPHLSPIMDNLLLPLTLLGSSCKWPFASFKTSADAKGVIGFFPLYAPYLHCDSPKQDADSSDDMQDGMRSQGKVQAPGGKQRQVMGKARAGKLDKRRKRVANRYAPAKEKLDAPSKSLGIEGTGKIYIPTCKTVLMTFSLGELMVGWAKLLTFKGLDALAGVALRPFRLGTRGPLKRFDTDVAREAGARLLARGMQNAAARGASRQAMAAAGQYAGLKLADKALFDGILKSMVLDGKVKLPYGLFSYSPSTGKGTFLKWGSFEGQPAPFEFGGVRGAGAEVYDQLSYHPGVGELVEGTPHATGPATEPTEESGP